MSQFIRIPNRLFDCAVQISPDTGKIQRKKLLPLEAPDIAVYIALLSFQQRGKQLIICKLSTLSNRSHMSVSSLVRALTRLEKNGLIRKIHRFNRYGCRASCGYLLTPLKGGYSCLDIGYLTRLSLSPRELCVLAWLNRCTGFGRKLAHPSVSKTAASCRLSETTVRKCISHMAALGILEKRFIFSKYGDHANNCICFLPRIHKPQIIMWMMKHFLSAAEVKTTIFKKGKNSCLISPFRGWANFEQIPPKPT